MADEQKELLQQIELLLESEDMSALGELLGDQRSSDIAEVVELVDNDRRRDIFDVMDDPMSAEVLERKDHLLKMSGREVFKNAVRSMAEGADLALLRAGMTGDDIDLLIPHQANMRIIDSTAKYAGIPREKVYVNVDRFGNMSSASIPVALDEALENGVVGPGSQILTVAFGAGFTWSGMTFRL